MRIRLERINGAPRPPRLAVAAALLILAFGLFAALSTAHWDGPVICLFRRLTGLPCPTCGFLRGTGAVLRGHPGLALRTNPLDALIILVVIPAAAVLGVARLARGAVLRVTLSRRERLVAWAVVLVAVAANWAYVLATQTKNDADVILEVEDWADRTVTSPADAGQDDGVADAGQDDGVADAGQDDRVADAGQDDEAADAGRNDGVAAAGAGERP